MAIHSSHEPIQQFAYREPFSSEWALPKRAAYCQGPSACDFGTAELPEGFGFKPLSARHETRLCVLMFFNETLSIFDVRVSVASFSFGKRNTTRQLSFTYRLIDQVSGCWLLAKTTDPLHRRTYQ